MPIYITGDTHSDFSRFSSTKFPEGEKLTRSDYVIVAGDFGLIWNNSFSENEMYNLWTLTKKPYTILFIDGNHDNHNRLQKLKKIEMFGGTVGKVAENIFYLRRGEVYTIEDRKFFTFGGARSRDIIVWGEIEDKKLLEIDFETDYLKDLPEAAIIKKFGFKTSVPPRLLNNDTFKEKVKHAITNGRRTIVLGSSKRLSTVIACRQPNINWWSKEVASKKERQYGLDNLKKHGNKVDFIVSHTPSTSILHEYAKQVLKSSVGFIGMDKNVDPTEDYLDQVYAQTSFKASYSGHMHDVWNWDKYHFLFESIVKIA